jgi:uncharacterized FlaG/YvyC family protein
MPHFNEFRVNEALLGKVLVARQNFDLSATEDEQNEVRQFLNELEEKKNYDKTSLYLRFVGFLTGKKYVKLKDKYGLKIVREFTSDNGLKPELRLSLTIERQIDFGDDVNAWRTYVHQENIRSEEVRIEKQKNAKNRQNLIGAYSETINKVMMKIN